MPLVAASIALVSTAREMTSSSAIGSGDSSGSSPCSRDSSITCWTMTVSRSLSITIRSEKRLTASGSSAASWTASASSRIAPTGVLSSWLTLATKSRRTSSTRRSRVRSSTRASTRREPRGATRTVTCRAGRGRGASPARSRGSGRRGVPRSTNVASSEVTSDVPRTRPIAYAGADAFSTTSESSTMTALLRSTDRTAATAGGTAGSSTGGWSCCWRSLMCQASTAPPATTAPISAARNACVVGSTALIVRRRAAVALLRACDFPLFIRRSPDPPGRGGAAAYALPHARSVP